MAASKPKPAPSAPEAPEAVQTPAPPASRTHWPADEFTGIGGDYVRDPVTGVRTRVPPPQAAETPDSDPAAS